MIKRKILIVDDEDEILKLLKDKLSKAGYQITTAKDGKGAIAQLQVALPDLILMDIVLPDLDGPEVVHKLQSDPRTKHIPVIFISGIIAKEGGKDPEIRVGESEYDAIGKPFFFNELIRKIEKVFIKSEA